tara:strand:- start:969 stop:1142 length:174 start_codon:yes stop_codon:yes gene_type:complete
MPKKTTDRSKTTKKYMTLGIPIDIYDRLKKVADEHDRPMCRHISYMLKKTEGEEASS